MVFKNVALFGEDLKFRKTDVCVGDGVFCDAPCGDVIDCEGLMMLPGLVDIHTHGAVGHEAKDGTELSLCALSDFEAAHGVTTFLPTTSTQSFEELKSAACSIAAAKGVVRGAKIGGVHMEGPYFSMKYKGAQDPTNIRLPDADEFLEINRACGGMVKLISIAPELDGAREFIKALSGSVKIAAGHTDADYATLKEAISLGLSHLTHSFNAMRPLHHREPGAIGAAIDSDVFCELICDGMHVHPSIVRLLYKSVGAERLVLVSDSVRSAYLPDGEYDSCGLRVYVADGKATLADGTIAGSSSTLFDCLRCAVKFGIPLKDAVRAATYNPAKAVGLEGECGIIKTGRAADFILTGESLDLRSVYVDGRKIK